VEITQTDGKVIDIGQKVDEGMDAVKDAVQDLKSGAKNMRDDLKTEAENMKDDIRTGAENIKDDIKDSFDQNKVNGQSKCNFFREKQVDSI